MKYAVCEISGKQVIVYPGQAININIEMPDQKELVAKVLALADDKGIKVGDPYLKETIKLKVTNQGLGEKIKVFKFHAKANYRRGTGSRTHTTQLVYAEK
jgi:large subunit ribosomal protein L21